MLTYGKMWKFSYTKLVKWEDEDVPDVYMTIEVVGDSIVGDKVCKKLHVDYGSTVFSKGPEFITAYEQNGRMWWIDGGGREHLVMDMGLKLYESECEVPGAEWEGAVYHVDTVIVDGVRYKRLWLASIVETYYGTGCYFFVEGIGISRDSFFNSGLYGGKRDCFHRMLACYDNGRCIFTETDFYKEEETGITDSKADFPAEIATYDLQGRRRSNFSKGEIFILNGKKHVKR